MLVLDYRGGGGGRHDGARFHARVRGHLFPANDMTERAAMLQYVAKLCFTLVVDNDFPATAWGPCVQPYLGCFLPPDAKPDEAKRVRGLPHAHEVAVGERPLLRSATRHPCVVRGGVLL